MDKERKCAWCGETMLPKVNRKKSDFGDIVERKCSKCGKVVAVYLESEGEFLPKMRSY